MSYLLPLGPFDQRVPGPQRLMLRVDGERIVVADCRTGMHARGCAERLRQTKMIQCYPLVNRVCGVHSHHHALAWTMALEELAQIVPAPRANVLRTLVAENERIASHLFHAARVVRLLGLDLIFRRLLMLREGALQACGLLTGHRMVHDFVRPGGVQDDLHRDEVRELDARLARSATELGRLVGAVSRNRSLRRRTEEVGVLDPRVLVGVGAGGWIGRAAGRSDDIRRDRPYGAYPAALLEGVTYFGGGVYARLLTLLAEAYESATISRRILAELPATRWRGDLLDTVPAGMATASVEAPSGPLTYSLTSDGSRLTNVAIHSTQAHNPALLREALCGALVDDAELIVASLAVCTACVEL